MEKENIILQGDALLKLSELHDNSVDAIVTDPPYGLSFMGKKWDYDVPSVDLWKEALRVLKPGAFLLSFSGTRTYHRMAVNIEDAGFEIRDMISWLYGSGFPKSLNIGKQIDKMQGNEREVVGESNNHISNNNSNVTGNNTYHSYGNDKSLTKGNSDWEGWGTALKPACEPIVVARKPLSEKNVALNVLKWGTGGINIDECRVESKDNLTRDCKGWATAENDGYKRPWMKDAKKEVFGSTQGRFPANIILDEEAGDILDEQSGISKSKGHFNSKVKMEGHTLYEGGFKDFEQEDRVLNDKGGASRFFYCAKASKHERNIGCGELDKANIDYGERMGQNNSIIRPDGTERKPNIQKNNHPTVKPIKLMEYLVKLVSKENAKVLDPFMGSGTTGIACVKLNREFIGIEREEDYIKIAEARISAIGDLK